MRCFRACKIMEHNPHVVHNNAADKLSSPARNRGSDIRSGTPSFQPDVEVAEIYAAKEETAVESDAAKRRYGGHLSAFCVG